ncbi:MAG: DUF502 domain-containing protein [Proteobacteria bacterium]|nr:DUF502 domain-containing protein [Burkholderiales bacterium]
MRRYFVTGLLIWIPIGITLWAIDFLVGTLDQSVALLPRSWRTEAWVGMHIPGMGVLITLGIVTLTGVVGANLIGQRLLAYWESLLARIPVVRSIYYGVKQVTDSLLASNGQSFRKAVMLQFPRPGVWTIGFLTGRPAGEVARHLPGDSVGVFIPLTPNPTSGYFLLVPANEVIELEMSVEEALKYIISMGIVPPRAIVRSDGSDVTPLVVARPPPVTGA